MVKVILENGKELAVDNSLLVFALIELRVSDKKHLEYWKNKYDFLKGYDCDEIEPEIEEALKHIDEYKEEIRQAGELEKEL